jgi:phospholipase/carboxylesterase
MPQTNFWRTDRPGEGQAESQFIADPIVPVRTYLPDSYEPGYAYPLVVLFHARGGNEEQVIRMAPRFSEQNFVFISLRGPEIVGRRKDGSTAYGWDNTQISEKLGEYVELAVGFTRSAFHIHSERIYLAGIGAGANAAFRAGFQLGDKVAGVIALNGGLPSTEAGPNFSPNQVRNFRIFQARAASNTDYPQAIADHDFRALYSAGADIQYRTYRTGAKLHRHMLRDVNRWIIGNVEAEYEMYASR